MRSEGTDTNDLDDRWHEGQDDDVASSVPGADRDHDGAYPDGVQGVVSAIVEMLRELNASLDDLPGASEPHLLPLERATRRFAADLRLMVAQLSRLGGQRGDTDLTAEQVRDLADAIGLLVVAAHALERIGGLPPPMTPRPSGGTGSDLEDLSSIGTLLAAFVVGVTMHGSPTSEDADELVKLADHDTRTLAAARARILQIDELPPPVRDHALELIAEAVRRMA